MSFQMDLQLVNKGLDFTRKKKKWIILLAAFGVSGYGIYRVYNLPSIVRKRKKFFKLLTALVSFAETVSNSTETMGIISKDLNQFLQSDSDEIPKSLKQISKIARSNEFFDSTVRVTEALTRGIFRGYDQGGSDGNGVDQGSGFYDRFMDRLFSNSGSGFASVVVGSFARNLVVALCSNDESNGQLNGASSSGGGTMIDGSVSGDRALPYWVNVMCNERCRELIGGCIQTFVSTAVAVYLDKTMDVNTYDELFAGLTNPKHEKQVRDMLVSVCNGSIETLVKTSHQVLSRSDSGPSSDPETSDISHFVVTHPNSDVVTKTCYSAMNDVRNVITVKHNGYGRGTLLGLGESGKSSGESGKSGWMSTMSSTLAVPDNRKFVLDVTGRVTFETVRSFLDFLLEKVFAGVKRNVRVVNEAIVDRGIQVVRYVSYKASIIATICISLCLHVLSDTRYLISA